MSTSPPLWPTSALSALPMLLPPPRGELILRLWPEAVDSDVKSAAATTMATTETLAAESMAMAESLRYVGDSRQPGSPVLLLIFNELCLFTGRSMVTARSTSKSQNLHCCQASTRIDHKSHSHMLIAKVANSQSSTLYR